MASQAVVDTGAYTNATHGNAQLGGLVSAINESPTLVALLNEFTSHSGNQIAIGNTGGTYVSGTSNGAFTITIDQTELNTLTAEKLAIFLAHELGHAEVPGGLYSSYDPTSPTEAVNFNALAEGTADLQSSIVAQEMTAYHASTDSQVFYADNNATLQGLIDGAGSDTDVKVLVAGQYEAGNHTSGAKNLTYTEYWMDGYALGVCALSSTLVNANLNVTTINWQQVTPSNFTVTTDPTNSSIWSFTATGVTNLAGNTFNITGSTNSKGKLSCSISQIAASGGITDYLDGTGLNDTNAYAMVYVEQASEVTADAGNNTFELGDNTGTTLTVGGTGNIVKSGGNTIHVQGDGSMATINGDRNKVWLETDNQTLTFNASSNNVTIGDGVHNAVINGDAIINAGDGNSIAVHGSQFMFFTGGDNNDVYLDGAMYGAIVTVGDGSHVTLDGDIGISSVTASHSDMVVRNTEGVSLSGDDNHVDAGDTNEIVLDGERNVIDAGVVGFASIRGADNQSSFSAGSEVYITGQGNTLTASDIQASFDDDDGDVVTGNRNTLQIDGDGALSINGDDNDVDLVEGGTLIVNGNNNTLDGYGATVEIEGGEGNTVLAYSTTVTLSAGVSVEVSGLGSAVNAEGSSHVTVSGENDLVNMDGGTITVTTEAESVTINGMGNTVGGDGTTDVSLTGEGNSIALSHTRVTFTGSDITVTGDQDTLSVSHANIAFTSAGEHLVVDGDANTVTATGAYISFQGADYTETVVGAGNTIDGSYHSIAIDAGSGSGTSTVAGFDLDVTAGKGDYAVTGSGNELHVADGSTIHVADSSNVIYANNATITLDGQIGVTIKGSGNTILGGDDDDVTVTGTNNAVTATNSYIAFQGDNSGDTVRGVGDTGSNWSAPDPDLPPGQNGGYTPPPTPSVSDLRVVPQADLLVHGMAAFLGGSAGASESMVLSQGDQAHLHLAVAA